MSVSTIFNFTKLAGDAVNVSDGNAIMLTVNGADAGQTVFHSFDSAMNSDDVQHVVWREPADKA